MLRKTYIAALALAGFLLAGALCSAPRFGARLRSME
jgi:hypothetical protein